MSAGNAARHRAARRPVTTLAQNMTSGASRRAAVVATAGGLIITTLAAGTAQAAPAGNAVSAKLSTVDLGALTNQARAALAAAPTVTVAAEAHVAADVPMADGSGAVQVTPAPRPQPRVVETRAATTSRSAARAEASTPRAEASTPRAEAPAAQAEAPAAQAEAPAAATIGAPAPAFANGNAVVEIASRYIGVPYVSGGSTPAGFDCSGLTSYVYAQVGINLPRTTSGQRNAGTVVSRADAQPGDLIWTPGHVAIYAGNGMQIDAPRPGKTIQLRSIWQSNPTFIRL